MAKIVNNTLKRETLSDVGNKIRTKAIQNFQDIIPYGQTIDTDPSTVLGRLIDIVAESAYDLEEVAEYLMSCIDLDTASGTKLEDLTALGNVFRKSATNSVTKLVVKAKPLTVIPQGSFIKNQYTSESFTTDREITINSTQGGSGVFGYDLAVIDTLDPTSTYTFNWKRDSSPNSNIAISVERGNTDFEVFRKTLVDVINQTTSDILAELGSTDLITVRTSNYNEEVSISLTHSTIENVYQGVNATSVNVGAVRSDAYTLTSIQSPVNGWVGVYNPFDVDLGIESHSDEELREAYREGRSFKGVATLNALLASLYSVDGVKYVNVTQNTTNQNTTIPANSFAVTVLGGRVDDLAQAIFDNTPLGVNSYGTESGNAKDINGNNYTVPFNRPVYVPIAIRIAITQQAGFVDADYNKIRQNIIDYFNTFVVGSSVTISRLYSPINQVPNHYVNSLEIGVIRNGIPEYGAGNINLDFNELATINAENIQFI